VLFQIGSFTVRSGVFVSNSSATARRRWMADYPYLAALPTFAWKNAACVRNGTLFMVPIERYYPGSMLLKMRTLCRGSTSVSDLRLRTGRHPRVRQSCDRFREGGDTRRDCRPHPRLYVGNQMRTELQQAIAASTG